LTLQVKLTCTVGSPRQAFWLRGVFVSEGLGFTVTVWVLLVPWQPSTLGITVIIVEFSMFTELDKVRGCIVLPLPEPGQGVINPLPQG
jgi:hypothetical protein